MNKKMLKNLQAKKFNEYSCVEKIDLMIILNQLVNIFELHGFKVLGEIHYYKGDFHEHVVDFEKLGKKGSIHFLNNHFEYAIFEENVRIEDFESYIKKINYEEYCDLDSILEYLSSAIS